jgi:hypothetical protein
MERKLERKSLLEDVKKMKEDYENSVIHLNILITDNNYIYNYRKKLKKKE